MHTAITATIIHIPHSSLYIPKSVRDQFALAPAAIDGELHLMTDRWTDELFDLAVDDIKRHVFPVSRLIVDPERFRADADEPMSNKGMGQSTQRQQVERPFAELCRLVNGKSFLGLTMTLTTRDFRAWLKKILSAMANAL